MRKKSKKKQIVAMTLALSVLSSSVGMCGASAAEALSNTDDSGLQVTVVPLANSNADTDTPADDTKTEEQPVASTGDNTDQPTDGEGDGDNTSSDDKPTIERPEQSDTVETLPGTAEDNKDHIKGEDKDDTEDKGDSGEETPGTGDTDTGDTEEKGEEGSGSEETPEEKPEETPKEDDTDYSCAYDPKSGHFKITFNIKEDAEGDQTIELSKVQEVVQQYGEDEFDKWLATEEGQKWYKRNESWIGVDKVQKNLKIANNVEYTISYTRDENGNIQRKVVLAPQAGDTVIYDVSLTNGSKHTYVYQDGSFTAATAKLPKNDDPNASVGFDGQPLPGVISGTDVSVTYNRGMGVHGCMEDLIDQLEDVDRQWDSPSTVRRAVDKYINDHYNGNYDAYILDYYNKKDGTSYTSVNDLIANNEAALTDLNKSGTGVELHHITFDSPTYYNHFYKNVLSLKVDDSDKLEKFKKDTGVSWSSSGKELTIGDYMYDKLNSTEGAWDKANSYFNALLSSGLNEDEATWAAFALAVNLDGEMANNNMQDKPLSWYASMVLHQTDGTLDLTKTDKDTGKIIGDDEGEGQTSFYLWKYEKDANGNESPMYCTYVEPTYTTNKDGEQVLEKDGFYCWVKYDSTKDKLTYTVTTTNGKLNIDYLLLENVVYYLQEAIAPDGYDVDPEIYVICDEESYKELEGTEVTNPATGATSKVTESSWLGSILGGKTLPINFVNTATVVPDPDPEPTPDPDPVPPVDPDIPVDPANPDNPPVKDADPDETPVTPENPQNPAVQDAAPDAAALPQTGTTSWMAGVLASLGSLLLACGWFFTRKQVSPKH